MTLEELYDAQMQAYSHMLDVRAKESAYPSKVHAATQAWTDAYARLTEHPEYTGHGVRAMLNARVSELRKVRR